MTDAEYLREALDGEYGLDAQAEAIHELQSLGFDVGWDQEPEGDPELERINENAFRFGQEAERLEKHIGRRLTQGESQAIVDDVVTQSEIPNLVETYAGGLIAREKDSEDRLDLMAEEIEESSARLDAEEQARENREQEAAPQGAGETEAEAE